MQVVFTAASNVAASGELFLVIMCRGSVLNSVSTAFSAIRIYALSASSKPLTALIFLLLLAPCVVDTVSFGLGVTRQA